MSRRNGRRPYMQDEGGEVLDILVGAVAKLSWYIGLLSAVVIYSIAHFYFQMPGSKSMVPSLVVWTLLFRIILEFFIPFIFFMGGLLSAGNAIVARFRRSRLYDSAREQDLDVKIRHMNWQEFEVFVGDWFHTQGYEIKQRGGNHPDGGVDVELRKDGQLYVVQCKHYFAWGKVGVELVRALRGSMSDSNATGGYFVTTGEYTQDAISFAKNNFITLFNIKDLVKGLKEQPGILAVTDTAKNTSVPLCPICSSEMVRRKAHRGKNAGHEFWGCSQYPECRGILPIA